MKDYSLDYLDSTHFILSYKIKNKKIIIKLASGKPHVISYSKENENIIINRMEEQAKYAFVKPISLYDYTLAIIFPLVLLPKTTLNFIEIGGWWSGLAFSCAVIGSICYPAKVINYLLRKKEVKKLKYFLAHKDELNKDIEKSENVKVGLSNKAVKEIEKRVENKPTVNINNLDNYSLKDLKQIRENIERISYFGFDESKTICEEKGPVLKMTLKDNEK